VIKIKIKNVDQIVKNQRNWLISKIAPYFVDVEKRVEEAIVKQIREVFRAKKIRASITIVKEESVSSGKSGISKKPVKTSNNGKVSNSTKIKEKAD
jgi:hypothetical protein